MKMFEANDSVEYSVFLINTSVSENEFSEHTSKTFSSGDTDNITNSSHLITQIGLSTADITKSVLYLLIFIFAVLGNVLVIVTLAQNKRMRTVTNVFLMNLAISDLLLGVFCMPFTLVGSLLRNFIFGDVMCRLIPYLQAVTVSVSVWTLVSISLERFFAICRPFRSRQWQTISHSYKVIICIWMVSLLTMLPIALLSRLLPTRTPEKYKCREKWPNMTSEKAFNIYLDAFLLVIPLVTMSLTYTCIIKTLYYGAQFGELNTDVKPTKGRSCLPVRKHLLTRSRVVRQRNHAKRSTIETIRLKNIEHLPMDNLQSRNDTNTSMSQCLFRQEKKKGRKIECLKANMKNAQKDKRKVVKMLFVVVLEFFICWTPLYVINTCSIYDQRSLYRSVGPNMISAIQLLAYTSSCCNPITYCFMHKNFRYAFLAVFGLRINKAPSFSRASDLCSLNSGFSKQLSLGTDDLKEETTD